MLFCLANNVVYRFKTDQNVSSEESNVSEWISKHEKNEKKFDYTDYMNIEKNKSHTIRS